MFCTTRSDLLLMLDRVLERGAHRCLQEYHEESTIVGRYELALEGAECKAGAQDDEYRPYNHRQPMVNRDIEEPAVPVLDRRQATFESEEKLAV